MRFKRLMPAVLLAIAVSASQKATAMSTGPDPCSISPPAIVSVATMMENYFGNPQMIIAVAPAGAEVIGLRETAALYLVGRPPNVGDPPGMLTMSTSANTSPFGTVMDSSDAARGLNNLIDAMKHLDPLPDDVEKGGADLADQPDGASTPAGTNGT